MIFLFVSPVAIFLLYLRWMGQKQLRATNEMCEASETFTDWRIRNPGVYIGLSDEGKNLLSLYIRAYDEFLRLHSYIDGAKHREWLLSLFNDLPPKSPAEASVRKGVQPDVFLFTQNNL